MNRRVVVIGGGAAGLLASGFSAQAGAEVLLLEKTEELAKKVRISGKGRCNITNSAELPEFIKNYPGNGRFLYGALSRFSNQAVQEFFQSLGVETKVERGGRVFPVSDDADQVANALANFAKRQGVQIFTNSKVTRIDAVEHTVRGVEIVRDGKSHYEKADAVVVATGGMSYPGTGSTGDGFRFGRELGHKVERTFPALVPLRTNETWVKELSGLSLKNVSVTVSNGVESYSEFGEMLFAHFGLTGPVILTLSRYVSSWIIDGTGQPRVTIDLKPALSREQLDERLQRDFQKFARKQFKNALGELLPKSMIPVIIRLSEIDQEKAVHQITKDERRFLVSLLKGLELTMSGTLPITAAIVTAGGINVKEINPKTMQSLLVSGLFFAGEVLDIDGITGGYNLQAAFSTGYLAGTCAAEVGEE